MHAVSALSGDTVEKLSIALVAVIVVISVLIVRSGLKAISKLAMIAVLAGLGVALFQNRVELGKCSQTCRCQIYGQEVDVPHLPFSCDY